MPVALVHHIFKNLFYSVRAPSANLFFISIILFTIFFSFASTVAYPFPCLAFPCPAYFCALPTSVPCLFPLLMPFFLCILPVSLPCLLLCPAFFLALPTSLPCLFPCPAFSLALPTSVPSVPYLFPCPAFSLALPTSVPSYFLYLLIYFFFECKLHGYIASSIIKPPKLISDYFNSDDHKNTTLN